MFDISSSSPSNGATDTSPDGILTIKFSDQLAPQSITTDSISLRDVDGDIPISLGVRGDSVTIRAGRRLAPDRPHTLNISLSVSSATGEGLASARKILFRTSGLSWHEPVYAKPISTSAWGLKRVVGLVMLGDNSAVLVWMESDEIAADLRLVSVIRHPDGTFGPREVLATGLTLTEFSEIALRAQVWPLSGTCAAVFWTVMGPLPMSSIGFLRRFRQGVGWSPPAQIPVPPPVDAQVWTICPLVETGAPANSVDIAVLVLRGPAVGPQATAWELGRVRWLPNDAVPSYQSTLKILRHGSPGLAGDPHATEGFPYLFPDTHSMKSWRNEANGDSGLAFAFIEPDRPVQAGPTVWRCIAVTYSFKSGVLARAIITTSNAFSKASVRTCCRPDGSATVFLIVTNQGEGSPVLAADYLSASGRWTVTRPFMNSPEPLSVLLPTERGAQFSVNAEGFQLILLALRRNFSQNASTLLIRSLLYDPNESAWNLIGPIDPHFDLGSSPRIKEDWSGARLDFFPTTNRFEVLLAGGWAACFEVGHGWAMPYRILKPAFYDHHWQPQAISRNEAGHGLALWTRTHVDFPCTDNWFISEFY